MSQAIFLESPLIQRRIQVILNKYKRAICPDGPPRGPHSDTEFWTGLCIDWHEKGRQLRLQLHDRAEPPRDSAPFLAAGIDQKDWMILRQMFGFPNPKAARGIRALDTFLFVLGSR